MLPLANGLDSASTVFVATDDTAIKKSVWLIRRACVLEDGVVHDEIEPLHITERDMAADILTKYLVFAVWIRHVHYLTNRDIWRYDLASQGEVMASFVVTVPSDLNPVIDSGPFKLGCDGETHITEAL